MFRERPIVGYNICMNKLAQSIFEEYLLRALRLFGVSGDVDNVRIMGQLRWVLSSAKYVLSSCTYVRHRED